MRLKELRKMLDGVDENSLVIMRNPTTAQEHNMQGVDIVGRCVPPCTNNMETFMIDVAMGLNGQPFPVVILFGAPFPGKSTKPQEN